MKVIGLRSGSQQQKSRTLVFLLCKTSIAHDSGSIKDRALRFAYIMGFSALGMKWRDAIFVS